MACEFDGCSRVTAARGYCDSHYKQLMRGVKITKLEARLGPVNDRFWSKVDKTNDCWTWKAATNSKGYGRFRLQGRHGPKVRAHGFSWELKNGPIPNGLCVLHKCDNPPCVNPDHLFLGTNQDNVIDKVKKNRTIHGEAHHSARLTEDQVREIRLLLSRKVLQKDLAARFEITRSTISAIATGKMWTRVENDPTSSHVLGAS